MQRIRLTAGVHTGEGVLLCGASVMDRLPSTKVAFGAALRAAIVLRYSIAGELRSRIDCFDIIALDDTLGEARIELSFGRHRARVRLTRRALQLKESLVKIPKPPEGELIVELGRVEIAYDEVKNLGVGAVVDFATPLRGPFPIRVDDRLLGHGELVNIDGKLGIRVLTLES